MPVDALAGDTMEAVEGPETWLQAYVVIDPSGSLDAVPTRFVRFVGKVIVMSDPAFATGGWFTGAAFTVILTVSSAVAPKLSVTFSWNEYTPAVRLFATVLAAVLLPIVNCDGPLNLVHRYAEIEPSGSLDELPFRIAELVGRVILRSDPAFASGG